MTSRADQDNRPRAFTLLEVLVAISIIAILIGLLTVGLKTIGGSTKQKATRVTLENCKAMLTEYEIHKRLSFGASPEPAPGIVLPPPEGVDRTGNAVYLTRTLMALLLGVSDNTSAVQKLPVDQIMTLGVRGVPAGAWTSGTSYNFFDRVYDPSVANWYICIQPNTAIATGTAGANEPANTGYWVAESQAAQVPILLDAWGNPIIFVPGGQLGGLSAGGQTGQTVSSPDKRPFFVSAGPDGNFQTGDDNVYSFEN